MLYRTAGRSREAAQAFRQALAEIKPLTVGRDARTAYRESRAYIGHNLGLTVWETEHAPEAAEAVRDSCETLVALAAEHPDVPEYQEERATALNTLGVILHDTGRHGDAEDAYRRSIADLERLVAGAPVVSSYRWNLAETFGNLGSLLADRHRREEAEAAYRRSVELYVKLVAEHPQVPDYRKELAEHLAGFGGLLLQLDRLLQAEQALRRSLAIREALAAEHPEVPDHQLEVARSQNGLGTLLRRQGRLPEAERAYARGLALLHAFDPEHRTAYREEWAELLGNLGVVRAKQGRWAEAIDLSRRSIDLYTGLRATRPGNERLRDALADRYNDLVWLLANGEDPRLLDAAQAVELARRAIEQAPDCAELRLALGMALFRAGDCKATIESLESSMDRNTGGHAMDWLILSMAHWKRGDKPRARTLYDRAVAWMAKNRPKDDELSRFRDEAAALLGLNDAPRVVRDSK